MATFDSVIQNARSLSLADRIRLGQTLLKEAASEAQSDEIGVGERGLAAWTDSTRNEDWSEFYPESLRQRKVS